LPAAAGYPWFSPDGRLLVITDAFGTKIGTVFDVATGRKLLRFGGRYTLGDVSFTPDGRSMAATIGEFNGSGTVVLYDTKTWHHRTLTLNYGPNGIAFVDGGNRFVTLSFQVGGRVDLWDTATLQPVGEPLTLTTDDNFSAIADRPGTKVVFGSFQGVTPVLDVSPTSWQRTACRLAGRNLTHAEWAQYFQGQAYRRTCARWPAGP
jgi:WD40 repeat protein